MSYVQGLVPGPSKSTKILLPESASYRKIVAYKIRLNGNEPWLGDTLRVPYNLDLDEAQIDGMSIRKHIHLRLTGLLDRRYGEFVWQEGDRMQSTTYICEYPESEWNRAKDRLWSEFVRYVPGTDGETS
jgi:hypothetical protein